MQMPLLVLLRCGFNFGNTSDDNWHSINNKNLLSITQNALEDTVLTVMNINWAYVRRGRREKLSNFFQSECKAKNISRSFAPPLPISCLLNWCSWCNISLHQCAVSCTKSCCYMNPPLPLSQTRSPIPWSPITPICCHPFSRMRTQTPFILPFCVAEIIKGLQCRHLRF